MRGVVYVAYGQKARMEAAKSIKSLRQHSGLAVLVVGDQALDGAEFLALPQEDAGGRWAKLNLDSLSPFPETLYLDADTRVHGDISAGFDVLGGGWEIAIVPSARQGADVMGHAPAEDRQATFEALGIRDVLGLQAGVMFIAWTDRTRALWAAWREEWEPFRHLDQPALLRALARVPVRVWLLGRPWNGGELIEHRFGRARG